MGRVEGKLDEVDKRFTDFGSELDRMRAAVTRFDEQVRKLENNVAVLDRDVKRFDAAVNGLWAFDARVAALQADHKAIQGSLEALRSNVPGPFYEDVTNALRRIEERLNDVASKLQVAPRGPSSQ